MFPVRLSCTHLVMFGTNPPQRGEQFLCVICGEAQKVESRYYSNSGLQCGKESRRWLGGALVMLRCTLPPHVRGSHYDEPFGAEFSDDGTSRLRSGSQGLTS